MAKFGATEGFWIILLIELIAAFYLAATVREFSRLVACKLIGWDIYLFRIWPVLIRFEPFAVGLGTIPRKNSAGWVLAYPPTPEKQTKLRVAIFNCSGAAANIVCIAAICLALTVVSDRSVLTALMLLATAMFFAAIFSLRAFQKNEPQSHFGIACLKALALRASGVAPRQWDSALVRALEAGVRADTLEDSNKVIQASAVRAAQHLIS